MSEVSPLCVYIMYICSVVSGVSLVCVINVSDVLLSENVDYSVYLDLF